MRYALGGVFHEENPKILSYGTINFESAEIPFSNTNVPWFFEKIDTEYILKIVLTNSEKLVTVIYQPCLINVSMKKKLFQVLDELNKRY